MITVVIPVYSSTYLIPAIESIEKFASTWVTEVIIVLDNPKIRFSYTSNIDIKIIKNRVNLGAGPSRNIGVLSATNRLVSFLDSDDLFLNNRDEYYSSIEKDSENLIWCGDYVTSEGRIVKSEDKNELKQYMINTNVGMSTITCRKEVFTAYGLFFPKRSTRQDTRWIISLLKSNIKIRSIPMLITTYRVHSNQISANKIRMAINVLKLYLFESEKPLLNTVWWFACYCTNSIKKRLK